MTDSSTERLHLGTDEAVATLVNERKENSLDRTLSETFPCSDPLSSIPDPIWRPTYEEGAVIPNRRPTLRPPAASSGEERDDAA